MLRWDRVVVAARRAYERSRGDGPLSAAPRAVGRVVSSLLAKLTWLLRARSERVLRAVALFEGRYGYSRESLASAEARVFSQNGEDGVIAELLERVGTAASYFVEFGAGDGREQNCPYLADVRGWSGLLLEADPVRFGLLARKYAPNDRVVTLQRLVTPATICDVFAEADVPTEFDVLSIDVDGQDFYLWAALAPYRPRIVVIEYNSSLGREPVVEPPTFEQPRAWDGTVNYGSSIGALEVLGEKLGYRLVHCELAGVNAFFVRDDLVEAVGDVTVTYRAPNHGLAGGRNSGTVDPGRFIPVEEALAAIG